MSIQISDIVAASSIETLKTVREVQVKMVKQDGTTEMETRSLKTYFIKLPNTERFIRTSSYVYEYAHIFMKRKDSFHTQICNGLVRQYVSLMP